MLFGLDHAGLNHLVGVMAAGMVPLHMRNGMRPEFLAIRALLVRRVAA
jgi:hypothetical protein